MRLFHKVPVTLQKPGQTVLIYEVLSVDGKQIFSSREKNRPVKFLLGGNQVIPGLGKPWPGSASGNGARRRFHRH